MMGMMGFFISRGGRHEATFAASVLRSLRETSPADSEPNDEVMSELGFMR